MKRSNRHVPLIMGVGALALAAYLVIDVRGLWAWIGTPLLLVFAIPSIKTALFASDQEIRELTGAAPVNEETKRKFEDRL
jgi:hypothetical protein